MTLLRSVLSWMENLGMIHQSGSEFFRYAALPNFGQKIPWRRALIRT